MNKVTYTTIMLFLVGLLSFGCSQKAEVISPSPTISTVPSLSPMPKPTISVAPSPSISPIDPLKAQIKQMTLDEKLGQMVLIGVDGLAANDHTKELIEKYHVGGIILYKENILNVPQALDFLNELKALNASNKIPLFLSVDQEGGRVSRLPDEFAKLPTNQAIGKINNPDFSHKIGVILGEEIKSLGFNMDFAPVLDINSNPKNPVIGDRSFSADAEIVRKLGVQTMLGIQSQHVIPVVKHFPGHGDTSVDSHLDLPVVNNSLNRLRTFEWLPFVDAIKNHADAVMVAHILLPQIDAQNPASMSKKIITDLLRNELKFNGVVITDDMTMGGIVDHFDMKEAAVKAINAGSDIVMVAHDYNKELEVLINLKKNAENGTLSVQKIDESVYRILQLKQKYTLKDQKINHADIDPINNEIHSLLNTK
ncbi:MAG: beta-glucosidase-like glycosyl hydrolase [Bacilli bacterium]|nr:beta-glucosidase-like glycosyl hydrolase [Bacilli bacterium]